MVKNKFKYTNKLITESSPYLLQHSHNPVNWYPWGAEALTKAKEENKLLIISIGYAACHWCHVMENESFENEEVAKFMNENFIAIKVDREERPDIDQSYMKAVQLLTGSGGWPLNCIALPDGRPIYGGTYFPKDKWLSVLKQVLKFTIENPDETEKQAQLIAEGVSSNSIISMNKTENSISITELDNIFKKIRNSIDFENGGLLQTPKFPMPVLFEFLLNYAYLTKDKDAEAALMTTLDKMADGGIYDQVGGGFARYSTDKYWKIPHFEKMLYDNAQLVSLYSKAYQYYKNPQYKNIVVETLNFIESDMTSKKGGFYASLDADSEGKEGLFYVWTKNELKRELGKNSDIIIDYYNISENGNWEHGKNVLTKNISEQQLANKYEMTINELELIVKEAREQLKKARYKRINPNVDKKNITAWNALMIIGYLDAYRAFEENHYLEAAIKNADLIVSDIMTDDSGLFRNYMDDKAYIGGFLDDYAFAIKAFYLLYQVTFNEKWLYHAQTLLEYAVSNFFDENQGMFLYASINNDQLFSNTIEITDSVIPSSNSQMAINLFVLGHYFNNEDYIDKSKQMLNNIWDSVDLNGSYHANWCTLALQFVYGIYEVAIVGNDYENLIREFGKYYLPNTLLLGGNLEGTLALLENKLISDQTTIYVCRNKTCSLPTIDFKIALSQLK